MADVRGPGRLRVPADVVDFPVFAAPLIDREGNKLTPVGGSDSVPLPVAMLAKTEKSPNVCQHTQPAWTVAPIG